MRNISILFLIFCFTVSCKYSKTPNQLYNAAVRDAVFADVDEIFPIVTIENDSQFITWNDDKTKVLMLSWHKYPQSFTPGTEFVCEYGEIWSFTDKEIINWYKNNYKNVTDWQLRFNQLIGLPPTEKYTHFSAFWVDTNELIRPAYQIDIAKQLTANDLSNPNLNDFKEWFDNNIIFSYFDSSYPWTRLGYTYDWADNDTEYGLTEFLIKKDSVIEVEFTKTTDEFVDWLFEQTSRL